MSGTESLHKTQTVRIQMTLESFLEELSKAGDRFEWRLEPDLDSEGDRREWARFQIRAITEQGVRELILGPIQAVCFALTGNLCETPLEAAKAIGLPDDDASQVTDAADDRTWRESNGRRRPDTHLQALRVDLIRAVETPADSD